MPVERRPDGWFDTDAQKFVPMLNDIYFQGRSGILDSLRDFKRRIEDLERRG